MEHFGRLNESRQIPDYARDALKRMLVCRTDQLGGHAWQCSKCNHTKVAYNSCKNRSCPQCGWVGVEEWAKKTAAKLRPVDHFHIIFSIPSELGCQSTRIFSTLVTPLRCNNLSHVVRANGVWSILSHCFLRRQLGFLPCQHSARHVISLK